MDRVKDFLAWLLRGWIKKHEKLEIEQSYISWTSFYTRFMWCLELEHEACPRYFRNEDNREDLTCTCPCHLTAPATLSTFSQTR